ncbi:MAG: GGDEF domain-containing protein [Ramlibacter sp.]
MSTNKATNTGEAAKRSRIADPDRVPHAFRHDWITYTMRRLEPWIAGSIALYTAWLAATVQQADASLWLFVAYAALIAKCCDLRPAHYQAEMFLRGLALVAGSYVLNTHIDVALEAGGGVFFFWLSITTLYYAFMLKPAWGVGLVGAAMAALTAAAWQNGAGWADMAAPLGFLAIFPLGVAMRFGVAMRRADEAIERSQMDATTGLYNLEGLMARGAEALYACAADHKPATLVVMDCADLQEVRTIYGRQTSRKVMARLVRKLNTIAGERGVVARTAPAEFALLLPGVPRDKACQAIDRALGRPGCIEYDAGDSEIVMVPHFAVTQLECEPQGLREAYASQRALVQQRMQQQAEHERYLTLERERHSRPAPLAPLAQLPPTVPAPLRPMPSMATSR